jgi:hypothetical protein
VKTAHHRLLVSTIVAASGIAASSTAMAHVDIGVNLGLPVAVAAPAPVYVQPVSTVVIAPGWYGDRYYDSHRYWAHDEWMRHHPNDRGWHGQHDDHHDH